MKPRGLQFLTTGSHLVLLILFVICWAWLSRVSFTPWSIFLCVVGATGLCIPVVWIGRRVLDADPTPARADQITAWVHYLLLFLLGTSITAAIVTAGQWRGWRIPLDPRIGLGLVIVSGTHILITALNLALRGLGAPFAIALSRRVAMDWLFAWTRNPMALGTLTCAVALGLWFQSALFVLWAMLWLNPIWIVFLKMYEERELEIRLGQSYLDYKARTPFLWPRRPQANH